MDSWIGLMLVALSVLLAAALNHSSLSVRTAGTALASVGCLAVAVWFGWVLKTGILHDPEPQSFAIDAYKPYWLWAQAIVATLAGLLLARVSIAQSKRTDVLQIPMENTTTRFGLVSRYLHWTTAFLILLLIPMGLFASLIPEEGFPYRLAYYNVHKSIGLLVLLLVAIRILWHVKSPTPLVDNDLTRWEKILAKSAHILLYGLLILMPLSGFIMSTFGGKPSTFFFWKLPLLWEADFEAVKVPALMHKIILPYVSYIVIGAHILGALKHHFIDKHRDSIHRMVG